MEQTATQEAPPEIVATIVALIGMFILIAWIVRVVSDGRRRQERLRAGSEFYNRLLDKLGSAGELSQFVQTGGTRFLEMLTTERRASAEPRERILRSVHVGLIAAVVGLGLLITSAVVGFTVQPTTVPADEVSPAGGFAILGALCLSLGVGFLLSSAVSYRLARSMGLLASPEVPGLEERR